MLWTHCPPHLTPEGGIEMSPAVHRAPVIIYDEIIGLPILNIHKSLLRAMRDNASHKLVAGAMRA